MRSDGKILSDRYFFVFFQRITAKNRPCRPEVGRRENLQTIGGMTMTEEQKRRIPALRESGQTYKEISEVLGVPVATIKTFCRRNRISAAEVKQIKPKGDVKHCLTCGKEIIQLPRRKEKKFCSDKCRMKWWNSHTDQINRRNAHELECPYCHKKFAAYESSGRKYCSHECYIADRFGGDLHD